MAAVIVSRREARRAALAHSICTFFASVGFLLLVVAITYFALLVASVHFGDQEMTSRAYRELGLYLGGELEWYRDARVLSSVSLLCGLVSLLFGVHPFARVTVPIAIIIYVILHFFGGPVIEAIREFALRSG
ncbi:MAG: hypothetical protein AAGD14_15440 [Planctomycetota bacterium]